MKRTSMRLADGRELIYFNESDDVVRSRVDPRHLPDPSTSTQTRHDVLLDEWVAVASHRQDRTHLPPSDECPLCPSAPGRPTEVPAADYDVVVFENRFPSFAHGAGRCEVVCFTADHAASFAALPPERVRTVLEAWADRTAALAALPDVAQVFPFENRGREIGVTLSHPHGQVYAYPFVTPVTRRMLEVARAHLVTTGGNLFDEVLAAERAGPRVVARAAEWTAFVPAAARWPFEVHLYPHRAVPDLPALDEDQRAGFGPVYLDVLQRLDRLFGVPMPYVAGWYQAPVRSDRDLARLHLRVFSTRRDRDKLKYLAGSESAMGVFVNDVLPERAAELLRAAGP
ncbi:MAG: galactose-1-phosphate uridylyltransferase [Actinomycetia bacterium]|jgi:UDPglucose--hexose-1-phosphate uridylyltransferase|nr:galactose-1-phosphate uridylyltransferase [Actinomycetes bacterium]